MQQNQNRNEVSKLENEIKSFRKELQVTRNRLEVAELELYTLKQYKEIYGDPEILAKAVEVLTIYFKLFCILSKTIYFITEIER